jgi:site-specific recombinase XerD
LHNRDVFLTLKTIHLKEDIMLEVFFHSTLRLQELRDGPSGHLLEDFAEELRQVGYSEITARGHIRAAEHIIYWVSQEGRSINTLEERLVEDFLHHLNRCRCPRYGRTYPLQLRQGVRLFIKHLQRTGVVSPPLIEKTVQDPPLFAAFCEWMRQRRGTSEPTLYNYGLALRDLLKSLGEDPSKFDAHSLRKFILERSQRCGWAAAKQCTTAARMFLRFLITEGQCSPTLEAAIPSLAHWRLSSLPRYLQPDDVERIIASCDPATPVGKRDRAILLLLARLGLRAGDIVRLRPGDIDWSGAWIHASGKGRCQTRLPLTQEIGEAIVAYMQEGRPQSEADRVFIRARAPFRALANHSAVSVIVTRAMRRVGVTCPSRGAAHLLRHSAATSMLGQGASLQEIAAILRHRSIETTQIYAKVDVVALRQIAQPWPEVTSC